MNCCVWPPRSVWHRKSDKIQSDENQTEFSGWVASIIQYFWSNNEVYQLFVLMFRNASPQIPKLRQRIKQAISAAESSRPIPMTWVELLVASVGTDPSSLIWHLLSFKLRIKKWQVSMAYHVWCWHVLTHLCKIQVATDIGIVSQDTQVKHLLTPASKPTSLGFHFNYLSSNGSVLK